MLECDQCGRFGPLSEMIECIDPESDSPDPIGAGIYGCIQCNEVWREVGSWEYLDTRVSVVDTLAEPYLEAQWIAGGAIMDPKLAAALAMHEGCEKCERCKYIDDAVPICAPEIFAAHGMRYAAPGDASKQIAG